MNGNKVKSINGGGGESGVALLFVLGISALMMILAVAFASTAINNLTVSRAAANSLTAAELARTAMQRAMAGYAYYSNSNTPAVGLPSKLELLNSRGYMPGEENIGTGGEVDGWETDDIRDLIHKSGARDAFHRALADVGLTNANVDVGEYPNGTGAEYDYITADSIDLDGDINTEDHAGPQWVYVERDNKIVGRYAWAFSGEPAEGDPVRLGACIQLDDAGYSSPVNENGTAQNERPGRKVSEACLSYLRKASAEAFIDASKVEGVSSNQASPAGQFPDNTGNVTTFETEDLFFDTFTCLDDQDDAGNWFYTTTDERSDDPKDREAYNSSGNEVHRFNLYRFTDVNGNDTYDSGTDTNLWDSFVTPDVAIPGDTTITTITGAPTIWADAATNGTGIAWFNSFADGAGSFADAAGRANQIAANLIDYCDTNDTPYSDIAPASWDTSFTIDMGSYPLYTITIDETVPLYTGNELTPMLNEISISLEGTTWTTRSSSGGNAHFYWYLLEGCAGAELINLYGKNFSGTTKLRLSGKMFYRYSEGNTTGRISYWNTWYEKNFDEFEINLDSIGTDAYKYTVDTGNPIVRFDAKEQLNPCESTTIWSSISANNIKYYCTPNPVEETDNDLCKMAARICVSTAVLLYDGQPVDYVKFNNVEPSSIPKYGYDAGTYSDAQMFFYYDISTIPMPSPYYMQTQTEKLFYSWQVDDPRQNLNLGDWTKETYHDTSGATAYGDNVGTPDAINSTCTLASAGKDPESKSDPGFDGNGAISSAFIHNDVIESPWELGFIHRAAPWETINLREYTASASGGAGAYADGDAHILDQIKMSTQAKEPVEKINVNLNSYAAGALAGGLTYGVKLSNADGAVNTNPCGNPGSGNGTRIGLSVNSDDEGALNACRDAIFENTNRSNRGELANSTLKNVGGPATDTGKEELVGKIVNLCKAIPVSGGGGSATYLTAVGQTIEDVGGEDEDINIAYKDLNENGDYLDTENVDLNDDGDSDDIGEAEGVEETVSARIGRYDRNVDKITAEQKIRASIGYELDADTGKYKFNVNNIRYIRE